MNINFDNTQSVKPTGGGLKAPNLYSGQKQVYAAERAGHDALGKAFANVGNAVAYCGDLLARYDQETVMRSFNEDMQLYKTRLSEKFALGAQAINYAGAGGDSPVSAEYSRVASDIGITRLPTNREEFQQAFHQVREWAKREIDNEIASGSLQIRNRERWDKEVGQMFEVQAANAMVQSTEKWVAAQEHLSNQKFDACVAWEVANGTSDSVKDLFESRIKERPDQKPLLDVKYRAARSTVAGRDIAANVNAYIDDFGRFAGEVLSAEEEQDEAEEVAPRDVSRAGLLREAETARKTKAQLKDEKQADYTTKCNEVIKVRMEAIKKAIEANPDLTAKDKKRLIEDAEKGFYGARDFMWSEYLKAEVEEQAAATAKLKDQLNRPMSAIATDPEMKYLAPTDAMLDLNDDEDSAHSFIEGKAGTAGNYLAAGIALSKLKTDSASFAKNATAILLDARLKGVSKEQYGMLFDYVQRMSRGEVKMSAEKRAALESEIVAMANAAYGKEWKSFNEMLKDADTIDLVDSMFADLRNMAMTDMDYVAAKAQVANFFNSHLNQKDRRAAMESAAQTLHSLVRQGPLTVRSAIAYRENIINRREAEKVASKHKESPPLVLVSDKDRKAIAAAAQQEALDQGYSQEKAEEVRAWFMNE